MVFCFRGRIFSRKEEGRRRKDFIEECGVRSVEFSRSVE